MTPTILGLFKRRPKHCMTCGDEFVRAMYRDGYRTSDGTPIIRSWWKCPRSDDQKPDYLDRWQEGRCSGLHPFACAVEVAAYRAHLPSWRACQHYSVSEQGDSCKTKEGRFITQHGALVAV